MRASPDRFRHRQVEPEWMDQPWASTGELAGSLRFIEGVNSYLGGIPTVLGHLERFARHWRVGEPVTMLDIGTGAGDIPRAVARWAARRRRAVRLIGLDINARILRYSAAAAPDVRLLRASALALPLAHDSVDYALCSMCLHHFPDAQAALILREMHRVARRGLIVNDLLRNRRAYAWIRLLTACSPDRFVRHDAPASVLNGYTLAEARTLTEAAGTPYLQLRTHFGHRFSLAGEKD